RFFARTDEVGAMAKLGEDGVEDDAAVRIVLRAEDGQRARRRLVPRALVLDRRGGGRDRQQDDEAETRTAAGRAGHGEVAAHQSGEPFDDGEPEAGAAIAARDLVARLRERTKEPPDL